MHKQTSVYEIRRKYLTTSEKKGLIFCRHCSRTCLYLDGSAVISLWLWFSGCCVSCGLWSVSQLFCAAPCGASNCSTVASVRASFWFVMFPDMLFCSYHPESKCCPTLCLVAHRHLFTLLHITSIYINKPPVLSHQQSVSQLTRSCPLFFSRRDEVSCLSRGTFISVHARYETLDCSNGREQEGAKHTAPGSPPAFAAYSDCWLGCVFWLLQPTLSPCYLHLRQTVSNAEFKNKITQRHPVVGVVILEKSGKRKLSWPL